MASFIVAHDLLSGIENAPSGTAQFYLPATLSSIVIYGDDTGTTTGNPVTLDSNGRATVYLSQVARMIVKTVAGLTVLDTVINAEADAMVTNSSSAFTGDTQKDVNDAALAAFGGQDFRYQAAIGAYAGMTPKAWMTGVWANVMAFASSTAPTINDGVTPADTAIAAAVAAVQAAGGGVVYFPPHSRTTFYRITAPITVTSGLGVSFLGAGIGSSVIKNTDAAANAFTLTNCSYFTVEDLTVSHTSTSTGAGIALSGCNGFLLRRVAADSHQICIDITGSGSTVTALDACEVTATTNAASRGVRYNTSGASFAHRISGGTISGSASGKGVEYNGTLTRAIISCVQFQGSTTAVLFNAALTGSRFVVADCPSIGLLSGTAQFDLSGLSADPLFRQYNNGIDGYTVDVAIAGSHTPDRSRGSEIRVRASSGGAGTVTVNAPTPAPTSTMRDVYLTLKFTNASGGAVTWAFAAATFVFVGAAVPASTDLHTITVLFKWDPDATRWREVSRGDTLT